jgi:signal recognition particle subunit SRP72
MNEFEDKTYELCYNSACLSISKGKYDEAKDKLKKAEEMCKEFYKSEEDFDEEELENELAIIKVQLAYCLQVLNKNDEALKIYNSVLKNK